MTDSTQRDGGLTMSKTDRASVMECATVNAVTTLSTLVNASFRLFDGTQRVRVTPVRGSVTALRIHTAGSSSDSRNRMWS